jgi:elongation factor P
MDTDSYEQFELSADFIGEASKWLKENDVATVLSADGEMMGVEPPMFVELEITECDPGFKGDTVQGGTKPATLETGAVVAVPMFLNVGDKIRVDTRDGRYVTRV